MNYLQGSGRFQLMQTSRPMMAGSGWPVAGLGMASLRDCAERRTQHVRRARCSQL